MYMHGPRDRLENEHHYSDQGVLRITKGKGQGNLANRQTCPYREPEH